MPESHAQKALIISDDDVVLDLLCILLRRRGMTVSSAETKAEAAVELAEKQFCCIIADARAVAPESRAFLAGAVPAVPLILVVDARHSGPDDFPRLSPCALIRPPFDFAEIDRCLNAAGIPHLQEIA